MGSDYPSYPKDTDIWLMLIPVSCLFLPFAIYGCVPYIKNVHEMIINLCLCISSIFSFCIGVHEIYKNKRITKTSLVFFVCCIWCACLCGDFDNFINNHVDKFGFVASILSLFFGLFCLYRYACRYEEYAGAFYFCDKKRVFCTFLMRFFVVVPIILHISNGII
jgi:hypothetical protein